MNADTPTPELTAVIHDHDYQGRDSSVDAAAHATNTEEGNYLHPNTVASEMDEASCSHSSAHRFCTLSASRKICEENGLSCSEWEFWELEIPTHQRKPICADKRSLYSSVPLDPDFIDDSFSALQAHVLEGGERNCLNSELIVDEMGSRKHAE